MAGAEYQNGSVLIGDDGKILAVGEDIQATDGMTLIDAGGRLL